MCGKGAQGAQSPESLGIRPRWKVLSHITLLGSGFECVCCRWCREWCQVYLKAARLAEAMQTAVTPDQPNSRNDSPDAEMGISHGTSIMCAT